MGRSIRSVTEGRRPIFGMGQNAYVESFNRKFRDEPLDQNWFTDLQDVKERIESWRQTYITIRPHRSLNDDTPAEFAGRFEEQKSTSNA